MFHTKIDDKLNQLALAMKEKMSWFNFNSIFPALNCIRTCQMQCEIYFLIAYFLDKVVTKNFN